MIPGLVDQNLLNEHMARYLFAARFGTPPGAKDILDAGCGAGYGTAVFPSSASVTAADISADAVQHAREAFGRPCVRFLQASCESLPFANASFDLVTAFEVIEHLEKWHQFVLEAARVLRESGVLLVSTPNKSYYAESRAESGPNPFHCHEFEFEEFRTALSAVFPHVRMWTQNHTEAIVFAPLDPSGSNLEAGGSIEPETAHFYIAACSHSPIAINEIYAWVPATANLLREREHHIAKLEGELAKKDQWLRELVQNHSALQSSHEALLAELAQKNNWAAGLNQEIIGQRVTILELQEELRGRQRWIDNLHDQIAATDVALEFFRARSAALEIDLAARTTWARTLEEQLDNRNRHVQLQVAQIGEFEQHLREQAERIEAQDQTTAQLKDERRQIAASKWMRFGRRLKLGPVIQE